ncbi:S41 family peptidase [Filimonas effusa]|uniref:Tricorn protease homolog n=1 Tax=Filimonas effusa TaxID=2508721 RepID=A0A4Q1D5E3_9BACT|nr:S41 family peptidase [Filimonas effusa]RXK83063.1 peptidase S41 [Filimonas effusa]
MKKTMAMAALSLLGAAQLHAQIDAGLFRFPDVSRSQIVFSYGNDLWLMPKEGGQAIKLSSPSGSEYLPKFSPDGKSIAFTGNYDGSEDVYVMPVTGGIPRRLTQHGEDDRVIDWTPDGKNVLFASVRESGKARFNQFYTIAATGGPATKLPLPYAEFGSYSPDGQQLAVVFRTQAGRNWKRYRGGWKADIHLFNLATNESSNISANDIAGDEFPMWSGAYIYFISDRGKDLRMNLWRYNTTTKATEQLTSFKDDDIHFPSMGPEDIVFEAGGKLYLYNLAAQKLKEVKVQLLTDNIPLKPRLQQVEDYIQHADISPDGKRVIIEARGDLYSLPAEKGFVKNLTSTSGAAERYPAWSPDGKTLAYWSDQSGEYELYLKDLTKETPARKLTSYGAGYRYGLTWSPDSKKLAFIDKAMRIKIFDINNLQTTEVDKAITYLHGDLEGFTCNWSPDSRWLAFSRDQANSHQALYLFNYTAKQLHQVTSGFYSCSNPVFDPEGKYLYFQTSQSFRPSYSDMDNSFIYANSTVLAAVALQKKTPALLAAQNDSVTIKKEDDSSKADDKKEDDKKDAKKDKDKKDKKPEDKTKEKPATIIDIEGFESRIVLLPVPAGNYKTLAANKEKLLFIKQTNTGAASGPGTLMYYDLKERETKTIITPVSAYLLSANGQQVLAVHGNKWSVIKPAENQKMDKQVPIQEMRTWINPREEWTQLFNEAWRLERDYFYDPHMHGVDWNKIKTQYEKILAGATTREDVNMVIGEMIGELNASHTYQGGGDGEKPSWSSVGYLGINWQPEGHYYKIGKIIRAGVWDAEIRSPLDNPALNIKEGDFILSVNGLPITTEQEPFAAFQELAGETVELLVNSKPTFEGARTIIVKTIGNEYRLRHLAWIEENRKRVDEATNGEAGYIYVPSTGVDGQNELIRQYSAQWNKKSLIIDERFNNGGQIPDRFIELLNRAPLAFWAIRDGERFSWPPNANFGPKVMLINGWSGSGGDAFPDYFRKRGLGPLIGSRTWGGLIGISGAPELIDGGGLTAPSFRMYNPDGTWFKEGHGVEPDIAVDENLGQMAKGTDPQLEQAITTIKKLLQEKSFQEPKQPPYEVR